MHCHQNQKRHYFLFHAVLLAQNELLFEQSQLEHPLEARQPCSLLSARWPGTLWQRGGAPSVSSFLAALAADILQARALHR